MKPNANPCICWVLFTTVKNDRELFEQYVRGVNRQAIQVKQVLGDSAFARFALGGGTPTQLSLPQLEAILAILNIAEGTMGAQLLDIPGSVEVSPETVGYKQRFQADIFDDMPKLTEEN